MTKQRENFSRLQVESICHHYLLAAVGVARTHGGYSRWAAMEAFAAEPDSRDLWVQQAIDNTPPVEDEAVYLIRQLVAAYRTHSQRLGETEAVHSPLCEEAERFLAAEASRTGADELPSSGRER